jgi:hypothetical protein
VWDERGVSLYGGDTMDTKKAPKFKVVEAVEAHAIYANYDAMAPNSESIFVVTDEKIAEGLCDLLNQDPRAYNMVYVDGYEYCKNFRFRSILIPLKAAESNHFETLDDAVNAFCKDHDCEISKDDTDDEDSDDDQAEATT